jgi:predicted NodU family carbamoyl transferase
MKYWQPIDILYKINNVPMVMNTSFDVGGKHIAETPRTRSTV